MAFFSRVGNVLRQTVSKQLSSDLKSASPSIYQAIRCMSSSKLFIGGLSYGTDETSLQDVFSNYGQVVEARVIMDRETGRSRGFGFVTYTSSEEASAAIQALDGQDLHGRRVRVNYATDRAPRMSPGYGSRGGNSYGGPYGGGGGFGGGFGGYDNAGGNFGGGGYPNSGYGAGGSPGNYNQSGFGDYGGQNSSPGNFGAGAGDGGSGVGSFSSSGNFGSAEGAAGNVSANSGFASSGFEEGSGLGHNGGGQFGGYDNAGGPSAPVDGDFKDGSELGLPADKEDDYEPDDYAKRA